MMMAAAMNGSQSVSNGRANLDEIGHMTRMVVGPDGVGLSGRSLRREGELIMTIFNRGRAKTTSVTIGAKGS